MPLTTAPRTRLGPHATPMAPWGAFTGKTVVTDVPPVIVDEWLVQAPKTENWLLELPELVWSIVVPDRRWVVTAP